MRHARKPYDRPYSLEEDGSHYPYEDGDDQDYEMYETDDFPDFPDIEDIAKEHGYRISDDPPPERYLNGSREVAVGYWDDEMKLGILLRWMAGSLN